MTGPAKCRGFLITGQSAFHAILIDGVPPSCSTEFTKVFYNYCLDRPGAGGVRRRFLPLSLRAGGQGSVAGAYPMGAGKRASRAEGCRHD